MQDSHPHHLRGIMPYIITTTEPDPDDISQYDPHVITTRRAVATLDEARDYLGTMNDDDREWNEWCREIGESGGTVGPLPDGTVIEVELVEWDRLSRLAESDTDDHARIIDAYNRSCDE